MSDIETDQDPQERLRALVINPVLPGRRADREPDAELAEAVGLAEAIDLEVVEARSVFVRRPNPAILIGGGVADELGQQIGSDEIGLLVIDAALTPIQQRNLERRLSCKVIDRVGLILEIFGARARTREGRLQVELAALTYQRTRLVRSWTHLERQRGGFGFLGGPGESQLEIDRRLIDDRIRRVRRDIEQVRRTRDLHRAQRRRNAVPQVALVGYTNAGKSTLFNRLTGADVIARDQLFATLDPTLRELDLGNNRKVVLSDTVGFIADLPTFLVDAFQATLEEVADADLILHVRDLSDPDCATQKRDVEAILDEIFSDDRERPPIVEVLNKIDLLSDGDILPSQRRRAEDDDPSGPKAEAAGMIAVSALTGEGLELLRQVVADLTSERDGMYVVRLPFADGAAIAWLHAHCDVDSIDSEGADASVLFRATADDAGRFQARFDYEPQAVDPEMFGPERLPAGKAELEEVV